MSPHLPQLLLLCFKGRLSLEELPLQSLDLLLLRATPLLHLHQTVRERHFVPIHLLQSARQLGPDLLEMDSLLCG